MKTLKSMRCRALPKSAIAAISLLLALPLATNHAAAQEKHRNSLEETAAYKVTGYDPATTQRFTATGRYERSKTVSWADLDLSQADDMGKLYLRLERAATKVCEPRLHFRHAAINRVRKTCERDTMDEAVSNVGLVKLEEMHASRTGRSVQPKQQIAER